MKVIGHRGACGYEAENSLRSLVRALDLGACGIEFDIRLTKDRVPILIHDENLDRTTEKSGAVGELSLNQLRELCDPNAVPSLEDALLTIAESSTSTSKSPAPLINVELKVNEAVEPTRELLINAVQSHTVAAKQILITSFDHDALVRYRTMSSDDVTTFDIGLLTKGLPSESYWELATDLEAVSANVDLDSVDANFVATAHSRNLLVMVYTVNTVEDANRMRELGVDAIFSDMPDVVSSGG